MLNKLFQKLDFKQSLVEDNVELRDTIKNEILEKSNDIINKNFNKSVLYIQDSYNKLYKYMGENIDSDLDNIECFQYEEYKEEILNSLKIELDNITKTIIDELPTVPKKGANNNKS